MKTEVVCGSNLTRLAELVQLAVWAGFWVKPRAALATDREKEGKTLGEFLAILKKQGEGKGSDAKTAKEFAEVLGIQASEGNWDQDAYMHGMLNGMVLMAWTWASNAGIVTFTEQPEDCPFLSAPAEGFKDAGE